MVAVNSGGGVVVVEGGRMRDLETLLKRACVCMFVDMIISAY